MKLYFGQGPGVDYQYLKPRKFRSAIRDDLTPLREGVFFLGGGGTSVRNTFALFCGGGDKSEVGGRTGLGRGRTDEVQVENGR